MIALTADERLRRARAEIQKARSMPEPTDNRAHGAWMKKQRSCIGHADREMRAARRLGADVTALDREIEQIWTYYKSRLRG
jgi:predicted RNA-binding protein YlxR (DUF448 family)